jgi:ABC-type uncharacterized transport system substrate-binding protein
MRKVVALLLTTVLVGVPVQSLAHPHVIVEANLEILRNKDGAIVELRHVWRFDELFSSTVMLDFDENGDGKLDTAELDKVGQTVTESISEYNFYTEVRLDGQPVAFKPPARIMVDYMDGQILMFFAETIPDPMQIKGRSFRVAVSDPTYYVAIEIADESAIQITGEGTACTASIQRPDFDKLYAQNSQTLTEQFFNNPNTALGDDWLTWIELKCD